MQRNSSLLLELAFAFMAAAVRFKAHGLNFRAQFLAGCRTASTSHGLVFFHEESDPIALDNLFMEEARAYFLTNGRHGNVLEGSVRQGAQVRCAHGAAHRQEHGAKEHQHGLQVHHISWLGAACKCLSNVGLDRKVR
jgi:hypothetical protein